MTSPAESFAQAIAHHQAGRLAEAEHLYRAVLEAMPRHPGTNHNLGLVALATGRAEMALFHLKAALEADGSQLHFWLAYIDALSQTGHAGAALHVLAQGRQAGLRGPVVDDLAARVEAAARQAEPFGVAVAYHRAGRLADAEAGYRRALEVSPGHPEAHNNLGSVLYDMGRNAEAEACFRRALALKPDYPEAHDNLGTALNSLGRAAEAEACHRQALALNPDLLEAYNNLGTVLRTLGRMGEALACYRQAEARRPDAWMQALRTLTDPPLLLSDQSR
jgi:tetratricopeptide (TPR) repeat protein